ncbi:uncharacterized protein LOC128429895 [Pleuronectes platessa]|uniref:uncharacterized protein LOC128429895 n=1 Tax=Pleuronectes platessa TaxID=8262 RepID=UPI00232A3028|nr:uncharacterized protein LOC128429895 [Pleuronectes platessa]XP_053271732.1 uncharacterized protein LOC128429895 [Pleuronectes platessa]
MKLWSRLCFLVLAVSSISRAQPSTTESAQDEEDAGTPGSSTPPPLSKSFYDTENNSTHSTLPPPSSPSHVSENATDLLSTVNTTDVETEDGAGSSLAPTTTSTSKTEEPPTDPMTTASSSPETAGATGGSTLGYVMMVLIFVVIIALCVILFFLRRASRTYSFDLQFPNPIINQFSEPIGTFEPVYLDDLAPNDRVATSEPPAANGTSLSEEKGSNGENPPQEQPRANGLETSSLSCDTSPPPGEDPAADKTSEPPGSANLFFEDTAETQQNENNNNPSVCSSDPFVEINLDDPGYWCDQLFTSPEATSSVLPFSPFSFSSSSSSSSSS